MARFWIAILFAALVIMPVQSRLSAACACTLAAPSGLETHADDSDSCCPAPQPDAPSDREGPSDDHRTPCDHCPRPCCTALKMTVPAPAAPREHPMALPPIYDAAPAEGSNRAAHLDRLERPPQRPTSDS